MWGISPQRIYLLQTVRIMNDECKTTQSVYPVPWSTYVCLHASHIYASTVAPRVFCWAHNKCHLIMILTLSYHNLPVHPWNLTSSLACVNLNYFYTLWRLQSNFTSSWPSRQTRECCKIPSADSVRLGWVKERSLWLLILWITPQYGIMLQWMSADTITAAQPWTLQHRFSWWAAMENRLM